MAIKDMREWISLLEKEEELARVKAKVNWELELGGILRENFNRGGPALLFENIKDYDKQNSICTKLFTASLSTYSRIALMLGLPKDTTQHELTRAWMERSKRPIKPVIVSTAPCKENILKGEKVDLFQFPTPKWNKFDGGRYIGTFHAVVTKDPDSGWENVGMYRQVIHDRNTTSMSVAQGQHIWMHWRKYRPKGKNMPLAVAIGGDPIVPAVACAPVPMGVDEWDVMGGLRREPIELVKCETLDLHVPASSEIVLEGEVITDRSTFRDDGPFAEFTGYYGAPGKRPIYKVNCITFRNSPIFQGTVTGLPVTENHIIDSISHSAPIWALLNERMTGVTGVNADARMALGIIIIQIENSYYGQVQQVATNVWSSGLSNMMGKNLIVVDEDIDIYDPGKVFWAVGYRVDPKKDIITFPGWISALDPIVHPDLGIGPGGNKGTRMLIDATKPIENPRTDKWLGQKWPPTAICDEDTLKFVKDNWKNYGIK